MKKKKQSNFRFLIVEDNKVNQLLVCNLLRSFGFSNFDCVDNGKRALEKLADNKYDLSLMDIEMPGMTGYELATQIRKDSHAAIRKMPIIALTANASKSDQARAEKAGIDKYVIKPYTPDELLQAIDSVLALETEELNGRKISAKIKQPKSFALDKFTGGDEALEIELIGILLRQMPDALEKLEKDIPEGEWKHVHAVAHKLKGSIAIFELDKIKEILQCMERYAAEKTNLDEMPVLLRRLKTLCKASIIHLEKQVEKLKKRAVIDN